MATEGLDVMLDIETLSTRPNALVLSIGAVRFSCATDPIFDTQFFAVPSLMEQIMAGRHVDQKTQEFWQKQPLSASDHWNGPNVAYKGVREALVGLAEFVTDAPRVWANGIVFDIGIMESLYRANNMEPPWKYNAPRDARTFYDTNPEVTKLGSTEDYLAHHPLGDCKLQIVRLWEHGWRK